MPTDNNVPYSLFNYVGLIPWLYFSAALPSLDELRAKIVGLIQAPATKMARLLNAPASQLARVVQAYASKGEAA